MCSSDLRFSENPDKFQDEFITLGLTFSLTWQDITDILAHCCTRDEKERILRKAREHADGLLAANPHHQIYRVGMQSQNMTHTGTMKNV